jgi:hypothetical protein
VNHQLVSCPSGLNCLLTMELSSGGICLRMKLSPMSTAVDGAGQWWGRGFTPCLQHFSLFPIALPARLPRRVGVHRCSPPSSLSSNFHLLCPAPQAQPTGTRSFGALPAASLHEMGSVFCPPQSYGLIWDN